MWSFEVALEKRAMSQTPPLTDVAVERRSASLELVVGKHRNENGLSEKEVTCSVTRGLTTREKRSSVVVVVVVVLAVVVAVVVVVAVAVVVAVFVVVVVVV